jgi:cobalt-zinc-cadmium efflux system membrane fusion protein
MRASIRFWWLPALAAAALMMGCGRSEKAPADSHDHAAHGSEAGQVEQDRVVLSEAALQASGIEIESAGSQALQVTLDLPGEVVANADRLAHIVPRFPGIAKSVKKSLGDTVREGEVLAIIESNESLSPYEVVSLISGTIIEKHVTLGEFVRDDADIFVVADLATVWVNITVYARDLALVKRGQQTQVTAVGGSPQASGVIDYVGPVLGETTRAATARLTLQNIDRAWRPGMFVGARVALASTPALIAVRHEAIQRLEDQNVVFVQDGEGFVARPVETGRSDRTWVEVLGGLAAGDRYAARGSFILKSERLKSEAGHDH